MSAFLSPALQYILYVTKTQYQLFYGLFANLASRVTASVSRMHLIVLFFTFMPCPTKNLFPDMLHSLSVLTHFADGHMQGYYKEYI